MGTNLNEDRMSARSFFAAAGLALAMIVTGTALAAAQDAPPAERPAATRGVETTRDSAADASRQATEAKPAVEGEDPAPEGEGAGPAPKSVPRVPSAIPASPPRPLGQTSRVAKVVLPTRRDPKTGKQVVVISNADLERIYGTSVVPVSSSVGPAAPGAASATRDDSAAIALEDDGSGGSGGNGAARIAEIDAELKRLNQNALAIANPFQPPPKYTESEKTALEGMDNKERLDLTRARIQELQQEKAGLESSPSGAEPSGQ